MVLNVLFFQAAPGMNTLSREEGSNTVQDVPQASQDHTLLMSKKGNCKLELNAGN